MQTNLNYLNQELKLPCGAVLKNRIGKSAMSENMANKDHKINQKFIHLYKRWAYGGAGLLLTGNIMIDSKALGEPRNVVFEKENIDPLLKDWANSGKENNTHFWTQLNHPGKQAPKFLSKSPVAPSAIPFRSPLNKAFSTPRELTEKEIYEIIERFTFAAKLSKDSGFSGVQIHGAHGYLVSQFLSPKHNIREDDWGGTPKKRMRFVSKLYESIRKEVGKNFPVGIKLNSADFQRGGFTKHESMEVVEYLSSEGMDLIEISGGTYESPVMMGETKKESTKEREAYFLDYCEEVRKKVKTPLMLTGGFRSLETMNKAIQSGVCDLIGLGRSIVIQPEFPNDLLSGKNIKSMVKPLSTGIKILDSIIPLEITWYTEQIHRIGKGLNPIPDRNALASAIHTVLDFGLEGLKRVRV
ncbi:MAG: NADH:flavin oxidoreductase/NADH oxidase family protein [Leptospiraceae bacterium]|nr:NADH:flavin oxidoreductase/NADH oxidase family protein [Leptospiraceae bacterium]MCK6382251.1 NADH:flavin oxidoreductase/NADH oxidase family protein [Leptospiraceae bacterium]NUM40680.1 NADH:flavin oxidoreductase/NADH oxidase family protein [Leptospiraceae bacterium]